MGVRPQPAEEPTTTNPEKRFQSQMYSEMSTSDVITEISDINL
jgi:hypothetical protein